MGSIFSLRHALLPSAAIWPTSPPPPYILSMAVMVTSALHAICSFYHTLVTPTPAEISRELQMNGHRHFVKGVWTNKPFPTEKEGYVNVAWYADTKDFEIFDVLSVPLSEDGQLDTTIMKKTWNFRDLVLIDHIRKHNFYPVDSHALSKWGVALLRHPRHNALGVVERRSVESVQANRTRTRWNQISNSIAYHYFQRFLLFALLYAMLVIAVNVVWPGVPARSIKITARTAREARTETLWWMYDVFMWNFVYWPQCL